MSVYPKKEPACFLPIDVQDMYLFALSAERKKAVSCGIAAFSGALKSFGVETIPVAMATDFVKAGFYTRPFPDDFSAFPFLIDKNFFSVLLFSPEYFPEKSDAVYVKAESNAFSSRLLPEKIEERGIKTVLIAGMNTTGCVYDSVIGAFEQCSEEVCFKIVYNLLADANIYFRKREADPLAHKRALEKKISAYLKNEGIISDRFSFVTSEQVLKQYADPIKPLPKQGRSAGKKHRVPAA